MLEAQGGAGHVVPYFPRDIEIYSHFQVAPVLAGALPSAPTLLCAAPSPVLRAFGGALPSP